MNIFFCENLCFTVFKVTSSADDRHMMTNQYWTCGQNTTTASSHEIHPQKHDTSNKYLTQCLIIGLLFSLHAFKDKGPDENA